MSKFKVGDLVKNKLYFSSAIYMIIEVFDKGSYLVRYVPNDFMCIIDENYCRSLTDEEFAEYVVFRMTDVR
jgi:hypothetical protein